MKLRNIFTMLAAAIAFTFVGCEQPEQFLDEIKVSKSYISLPVEGGDVKIEVDAVADWSIVAWDAAKQVEAEIPEWLTVEPASGSKGKVEVVFSAEATAESKEVVLHLNCDGACQVLNVVQITEKAEPVLQTCDWINNNAVVGTVYRVKGAVVKLGSFEKYGSFYVNDGTTDTDVYIYGSDANKTASDLAVGDIVTFEGPWSKYGNFDSGTTVVSVEKSLIKVEKVSPAGALSKDGDVFTVTLTSKGEGLEIRIPEADQAWLEYSEPFISGTTAVIEFAVNANEAGARKTTVAFVTLNGEIEYSATVDIEQQGAISEVSVAEFLNAAEGPSLYKLTGRVTNLRTGDYGNFDLVDATGSVYVYGLTATPVSSNDKSFPTLGIKEGDVVTLVGTRASHNGTAQVGGPAYYVSHVGSTVVTVQEFRAKEDSADKWYRLTGTIKEIAKAQYGNFYLEDETGSIYVYGLTAAPVASNDQSFEKLGLKVGDKVTIVGTRASHNGTAQVGGPAYYVSHEAAAEGGEEGGEDTPPASGDANTLTFTDAILPTAYPTTEATVTVSGADFKIYNVANFGNGIQMKKEGSYITCATDKGKIAILKLTWKKNFYPENLTVTAGAGLDALSAVDAPVTDTEAMTATYDFSKAERKFFKIMNTSTYATYLDKIEITYTK